MAGLSAGTITLILSIFFVLIMVAGFLVGMWRGVRRASVNLGFAVVGAIVAFFTSSLVTNALLKISINGDTLQNLMLNLLKQDATIASLLNASEGLQSLVAKLPFALLNCVVFILLAAAIQAVLYIIYRIFVAIFVKNKAKDGTKIKRHRLAGGAVGLVKTLLLTLFIAMPFSSMIGMTSAIVSLPPLDETQQSIIALPAQATEAINGVKNSPFCVLTNIGLDDLMYDYLSEVNVGTEKVKVRQEVENYTSLYTEVIGLKNAFEKNDMINSASVDKLENSVNNVLNSGLYNSVFAEVLDELISNHENYEFMQNGEIGEIVNAISLSENFASSGAGEYFKHDLKEVVSACRTLAESGLLNERGTLKEIIVKLGDEKYSEPLKTAIDEAVSMYLVKDGAGSVLNRVLTKVLGETGITVKSTITDDDWTNLSTSIVEIVKSVGKVIDANIQHLLEDISSVMELDIDLKSTMTGLGEIIDSLRGVTILEHVDEFLADKNIKLPLQGSTLIYLDDQGQKQETSVGEDFGYTELMTFLATPLEEMKKMDIQKSIKPTVDLKNALNTTAGACNTDEKVLHKIFIPLDQIDLTKPIVTELFNSLKSVIDLTNLTSGDFDFDLWNSELGYISKMLSNLFALKSVDAIVEGNYEGVIEALAQEGTENAEFFLPILYSNSTETIKAELVTILKNAMDDMAETSVTLSLEGATLTEGAEDDQANEIAKVFNAFVALYTPSGDYSIEQLDKAKLGAILDALKENAYRVELKSEKTAGVFKDAFDKLFTSLKQKYNGLEVFIQSQGYEHDYDIDFTEVLTQFEV